MSEAVVDDIVAVLPALLQSLEALGFVARHLNPPDFDRVMDAAGAPDEALRAVRSRLADWPEEFSGIRTSLEAASDAALAAFAGLRVPPRARTPACWRASRSLQTRIAGSFTTTTTPAAAAASRFMCRNITRPTAAGRW